ncbi:hypothetical protein JCM17844_14430 [Iodidimonas gelatinilytica]|uniref:SMODS-associating 2TM beta-strand rich effector domain-containing protein n=1 Tax=Iodidimonas gelatinilytica TaxID=1236966 RepID=A0A5A7N0Q7_9PROT|nr:hypothetical protein [Iodidimonas gelatinilytica]GEQ97806.1 hypothetical protein JCM17844_14430 [Iodidimonas gelatinilytica]GER01244.1 hypothetical protein JCM17845_18670 [Iodidimonas gelatinilytica]
MTIAVKHVDTFAAFAMSLVATVTLMFVAPLLETLGVTGKILASLVSLISFYAVFALVRRLLLKLALKHILGDWMYVTYPHRTDEGEDCDPAKANIDPDSLGFGYMRFSTDETGQIRYCVDLFNSFQSLCDYVYRDKGGEDAIGDAISLAAELNTNGQRIHLLYHARFIEAAKRDRYGRLFLNVRRDGSMTGTWSSDIDGAQILSVGQMRATRPERFPGFAKNTFGVTVS